jgi:hypothetical protein
VTQRQTWRLYREVDGAAYHRREIFKLAMEDFNIAQLVIQAIYQSVRAAGGSAWQENARLKSNGEKRILREMRLKVAGPTL